jgi:predicted dehydrogenase
MTLVLDPSATEGAAEAVARRPRIGFLGLGWIGLSRMRDLVGAGVIEPVAIADPVADQLAAAAQVAPKAAAGTTLDDLLAHDLDGVVIATPSALHAEQALRALAAGVAVFCQKPLARSAAQTAAGVEAARRSDRLLGLDLSYRRTRAVAAVRDLVAGGALGKVFAADLVFHNAYGPDKAWFYDPRRSGGGCLIDLGVHLVDLALWALDFPRIERVEGALFAGGDRLRPGRVAVEDYAAATLDLAGDITVRIACSWRLNAGADAQIEAAFYGTAGGARMRNVGGSFYDFRAERLTGTACETIVQPPDDWGGRTVTEWAMRLARDPRFDPEANGFVQVAEALDAIYGRKA